MKTYLSAAILCLFFTQSSGAVEPSRDAPPPVELRAAQEIIQKQSCGDCLVNTRAQLEALAVVERYTKDVRVRKDALLLKAQGLFDLAVIHYRRKAADKESALGAAREAAREVFREYPDDPVVLEKYAQMGTDSDIEKADAYARLAQFKPANAEVRFLSGLYGLRLGRQTALNELKLAVTLVNAPVLFENMVETIASEFRGGKCTADFDKAIAAVRQAMQGVDRESNRLTPELQMAQRTVVEALQAATC
jgi:hypothetical protein